MSEAQIQKKIIEYLNRNGAYTVKTIATNRNGCPDVLMCLKGRFIALEIKTDKGIVSEIQKYNINEIIKSGGVAAVVRSIEDVKLLLEDIGGMQNPIGQTSWTPTPILNFYKNQNQGGGV